MNEGFAVRAMSRAEVDMALDWAEAEGWNPGLGDADAFFATDPNGFFVAERDGRPVGCISAVAYDHAFGFTGLYIVRPDGRGQGYGRAIGRTALNYLGRRTVGLDGVLAQVDSYARGGFRAAHHSVRFAGSPGGQPGAGLSPAADVPFDLLARYDREHFPAARPAFLRRWIAQRKTTALVAVDSGAVQGFGVIRPCRRGFKIGPLFADTEVIAERIFSGLAAAVAAGPVFLDVPVVNEAALALAKRHAMTAVFETVRMYLGPAPALPLEQIFGITSFELG